MPLLTFVSARALSLLARAQRMAILALILFILGAFGVQSARAQTLSAPGNVNAAGTTGSVTVTWTAVSGAASYKIYRSTTSGGEGTTPYATGVTGTSYTDSSVTDGNRYNYTVTAVGSAGNESAQSNEGWAFALDAPGAPSTVVGSQAVTLLWGWVNPGFSYRIYRGTSPGAEVPIVTTNGVNYTDMGLTNGTTYYYKITAVVDPYSESAPSPEISVTPHPPLTSPSLTAVPSSSTVSLAWSAVPSAMGYNVKRATQTGGWYTTLTTTGTGTTYTDTPPTGDTYYYVVSAVNGSTEGPDSNEAAASTGNVNSLADIADSFVQSDTPDTNYGNWGVMYAMNAPWSTRNLYVTFDLTAAGGAISNASLQLYKMSGPSDTEKVYGVSPSSWTESGITWNNAPGLTGTPIATTSTSSTGQYYSYDVTSYMQAQQAAGATSVSFGVTGNATTFDIVSTRENHWVIPLLKVTVGAPVAPQNLTATGGSGQVQLSWNAVPGATGYNLYRGIGDGSIPTSYQTGLTGTSYTDTSVTSGTTYTYLVKAVSANGEGAASNTVSTITTPTAPTGLTATSGQPKSVPLTWNRTTGAIGYNVYRGTSSGAEAATPVQIGLSTPAYTDTGLADGATYYYKVTATNVAGESPKSAEVSATTDATPTTATAASASPSPATGTTTALSVLGADDGGEASLTYTWAVTASNQVPVTFSQNGTNAAKNTTVTFAAPGSYTFTVTVSDAYGLTTTSNVTVTVAQTLTSIAVQPATLELGVGGSYTFSATALDQFSDVMALQPVFTWSLDTGSVGEISTSGAFSADATPGTATVRATSGAVSGTAQVTVEASSGISLTAVAQNRSAALSWNLVEGANLYNVKRSLTPGGPYTTVTTLWYPWEGAYTDTGLDDGVTYYYVVTSLTEYGGDESAPSNEASATPFLGAATGLTAVPGDRAVYLSWTPAAGVNNVAVLRSTTNGGPYEEIGVSAASEEDPSGTHYTDTSVENGVTYYYVVESLDTTTYDFSAPSNQASATPSAPSSATINCGDTLTGSLDASDPYAYWSGQGDGFSYAYDYVFTGVPGHVVTFNLSSTDISTMRMDLIGPGGQFLKVAIDNPAQLSYWVQAAGQYTIEVSSWDYENVDTGSFSISMDCADAAAPTVVNAASADPNPVTGTTTNLSVLGSSNGSDNGLTYTWSATGPAAVTYSGNGTNSAKNTTATFTVAGTYVFTVAIADALGETTNSSVTVAVDPTLTSLSLTPASAAVSPLGVQPFTAVANDQFGDALSSQPDITWSIDSGGVGTIDSSGNYTAPSSAGSATVRATSGTLSAAASVSVTGAADPATTAVYRINCGGGDVSPFVADEFFSSGSYASSSAATIDTSHVSSPAPQAVYQSCRLGYSYYGGLTYTLPYLTPGAGYTVRLHFAETFDDSPPFNILLNGAIVAPAFDIADAAGGYNSAVVRTFNTVADPVTGNIEVALQPLDGTAEISGIEVFAGGSVADAPPNLSAIAGNSQVTLVWSPVAGAASYTVYRGTTAGGEAATPYASGVTGTSFVDSSVTNGQTYYYVVTAVNSYGESPRSSEASATPAATGGIAYKINCGGGAVGDFSADEFSTGGVTRSTTDMIDMSGVGSPAPQGVYQSQRGGSFSYQLPGLTPGGAYTVRLHFADIDNAPTTSSVTINGVQVLSGFSPYNATGNLDIAIVQQFSTTADASGAIAIVFTGVGYNSAGCNGIEVISGQSAPNAPTGLSATPDNGKVTLSWSSAIGASSYNVYRGTTAGGEAATPLATGVSIPYADTSVTNGTAYFYKVTAVDAAGESTPSNEASATPLGNILPAVYRINCGGDAVYPYAADSYFDSGSESTDYSFLPVDLSRAFDPAPPAVYTTCRNAASPLTYTFPGLTPGAQYTVRLHFRDFLSGGAGENVFGVAINGTQVLSNFDVMQAASAGQVVIEPFSATADGSGNIAVRFTPVTNDAFVNAIDILSGSSAPGAPLSLHATAGDGQVTLTWNAVPGASSYNVYRATTPEGEGGTPYATGQASPTFTDTNVTDGGVYYYVVTAVNVSGESSVSNEASAMPSTAGSNALYRINSGGSMVGWFQADEYSDGGSAIPVTSDTVDTSHVANPAPMGVYQSGRSTLDGSGLYQDGPFNYVFPNLTPGAPYTVRLHFADLQDDGAFNVLINNTAVLTNFDIYQAAGGADIALVKEFNATAKSNGLLVVTVQTSSGYEAHVNGIEIVSGTTAGAAPSAVTTLTVSPGNAMVNLSWIAQGGAVATSYNVYRSTTSGQEGGVPFVKNIRGTSFTDTNVTNGVTYYYIVTGVNTAGESTSSNEASGTPEPPSTAPIALTATANDGYVDLNWSGSDDYTLGWNIKRSPTAGGPYTLIDTVNLFGVSSVGTSYNYTDINVADGNTYYYVVSGSSVGGEGSNSNEASAAPMLMPPHAPTHARATGANNTVILGWYGVPGATSYSVLRADSSGGPYTVVANCSPSTDILVRYTDASVASGHTYYYVVTATNSAGTSQYSNEASGGAAIPILTASQAAQIATTFCQSISAPIMSLSTTATYPAPAQIDDLLNSYYQPRWLVQFGNPAQIEVEVVDGTGAVDSYVNDNLIAQMSTDASSPGTPISQNTALGIAASALQASGQTDELDTPVSLLEQSVDPPTEAGQRWIVSYPRMYNDVPYIYDTAQLDMIADTGAIVSMSLNYSCAPPSSMSVNVSSSTASQIAAAVLPGTAFQGATLAQTKQEVVLPNKFWQTAHDDTPLAGPSFLAWICDYRIVDTNGVTSDLLVFVNCGDGSIIGGEVESSAAARRLIPAGSHQSKLQKVQNHSNTLKFGKLRSSQKPTKKRHAAGSSKHHGK